MCAWRERARRGWHVRGLRTGLVQHARGVPAVCWSGRNDARRVCHRLQRLWVRCGALPGSRRSMHYVPARDLQGRRRRRRGAVRGLRDIKHPCWRREQAHVRRRRLCAVRGRARRGSVPHARAAPVDGAGTGRAAAGRALRAARRGLQLSQGRACTGPAARGRGVAHARGHRVRPDGRRARQAADVGARGAQPRARAGRAVCAGACGVRAGHRARARGGAWQAVPQ